MRPRSERIQMVTDFEFSLSKTQQCLLLSIHRSGLYYKPVPETEENLEIMRKLDELYFRLPFYGEPKLTQWLRKEGYTINSKRVRRLMWLIDWRTIYREPKTTISDPTSYKYPYLLRGLKIVRNNQVWAIDITYIPMERGFMYLVAIIDIHSRFVVNWSISNSMTAEWCVEVLLEAIKIHGKPEIFNSDQGSQFTSLIFTKALLDNGILPSMDGKGRAIDNIFIERLWRTVKYENIYLKSYEDGVSLYNGLVEYFEFYNFERQHQSLKYNTPSEVYKLVA